MSNVFDKGCLVQLSSSVWGATRKIQASHVERIGAPSKWLTAKKKLVDPKALKPIQNSVCNSRLYLSKVSLPFPIQAMVFVPKEMITTVDYHLNQYKIQFDDAVEIFLAEYQYLRKNALEFLGELFNETDYPADVRSKFNFTSRFVTINVPNGNTRLLAPEVYEREKEKFVQTMDDAREMAIHALREEFASHLERITDRFSSNQDGKAKIFKNGTVNNFYEYFETFKQRNIFEDQELSELVNRAQEIMGGHSADVIRSDDGLKERIRKGMEKIEEKVDDLFNVPRRRIVMS